MKTFSNIKVTKTQTLFVLPFLLILTLSVAAKFNDSNANSIMSTIFKLRTGYNTMVKASENRPAQVAPATVASVESEGQAVKNERISRNENPATYGADLMLAADGIYLVNAKSTGEAIKIHRR